MICELAARDSASRVRHGAGVPGAEVPGGPAGCAPARLEQVEDHLADRALGVAGEGPAVPRRPEPLTLVEPARPGIIGRNPQPDPRAALVPGPVDDRAGEQGGDPVAAPGRRDPPPSPRSPADGRPTPATAPTGIPPATARKMAAPRVIARQASSPRACSCSRVDPNAPGASASAASRTARHACQSSSPRRITASPAECDGSGSLVTHPHLARSRSILPRASPMRAV
jgi:hypothetical protein